MPSRSYFAHTSDGPPVSSVIVTEVENFTFINEVPDDRAIHGVRPPRIHEPVRRSDLSVDEVIFSRSQPHIESRPTSQLGALAKMLSGRKKLVVSCLIAVLLVVGISAVVLKPSTSPQVAAQASDSSPTIASAPTSAATPATLSEPLETQLGKSTAQATDYVRDALAGLISDPALPQLRTQLGWMAYDIPAVREVSSVGDERLMAVCLIMGDGSPRCRQLTLTQHGQTFSIREIIQPATTDVTG